MVSGLERHLVFGNTEAALGNLLQMVSESLHFSLVRLEGTGCRGAVGLGGMHWAGFGWTGGVPQASSAHPLGWVGKHTPTQINAELACRAALFVRAVR